MADIRSEYRERHGLPLTVQPITEGVLFFQKDSRYSLVALVSSLSKTYTICPDCRFAQNSIVLETFTFGEIKRPLVMKDHVHYTDEFDVIKECKHGGEPIVINSSREMEKHIWQMFYQIGQNDPKNLGSVMRNRWSEENIAKRKSWQEDVMFMIDNSSSTFRLFYDSLYAFLMINRKYMLVS